MKQADLLWKSIQRRKMFQQGRSSINDVIIKTLKNELLLESSSSNTFPAFYKPSFLREWFDRASGRSPSWPDASSIRSRSSWPRRKDNIASRSRSILLEQNCPLASLKFQSKIMASEMYGLDAFVNFQIALFSIKYSCNCFHFSQ